MFFTILGFFLSSLIVAIFLGYKITQDIFPNGLKKFLNRVALSNWQKSLPKRHGFYNTMNPKTTVETGITVCQEESDLEELAKIRTEYDRDELEFYGVDNEGNGMVAKMTRSFGGVVSAKLYLMLDGIQYSVSRTGKSSSSFEFTLGNFKLEMVEPMRCWRIWYNGSLECENKGGDSVHAVINFLWKPLGDPTDLKRDANLNLLAQYFTNSSSFGETFVDLPRILPDGYTQFGAQHGTIKIDEVEMRPLYLYGFRTRTFTSSITNNAGTDGNNNSQYELFGMSASNGTVFRLSAQNDGWTHGTIHYTSEEVNAILNIDFEPGMLERNQSMPKLFTIKDKKTSFLIQVWPSFQTHKFSTFKIVHLNLAINGLESRGILLCRKLKSTLSSKRAPVDSNMNPIPNIDLETSGSRLRDDLDESWTDLMRESCEILPFESELAQDVSMVGGKGASLARLARSTGSRTGYKTAKGFCITTSLFSSTLDLEQFRSIFAKAGENELDEACSVVMNLVRSSKESIHHIHELISSWIQKTFGDATAQGLRFAVRSSGVLEDSDDLSCAGQNETFLGVLPHEITTKVLECWASLFTPQSVHYRLNHGQPAISEMAVVIQEMIQPQAAGVIFTANPRTGNPFEILINANYGLGESVVSAACDPDTIILLRSRSSGESSTLSIGEKVLGEKKSKIVQDLNGSTTEVKMTEEESQKYCLTDELALKLGKVALQIERLAGEFRPVDIEWAIDQAGVIYILQSRNITSLDSWTDFELIHEMDTGLRTTFERITDANTGEVMPGATSTLSLSLVTRILDFGIQRRMKGRTANPTPILPYTLNSTNISRQRFLLNVFNTLYRNNDPEINAAQVAADLSIFGHRVIDEELHRLAVDRFGLASGKQKLRELIAVTRVTFNSNKMVEEATKKYERRHISFDESDSRSLYRSITDRMIELYDICHVHCAMSEASGTTQMFAFLTLAQDKKPEDWDSNLYGDISQVLSVCADVESADFPSAMDELANAIVQHGGDAISLEADFSEKSPQEGFEWLRNHNNPILLSALDKFFEKHGHRCICELDLMRKSWKSDPIPFVTLLQSLVRNKVKFQDSWRTGGPKSNHSDVETLVTNLKTPLTWFGKKFLKFLLPYCRNAVWNREKTKSLLVWIGDQLKLAYDRLAQEMLKEHLIPNERLMYFMTHREIGSLLNRHPTSSRILYKAMRRSKLHPELNKEQFEEITVGIREPIDQSIQLELGDSIQATSVSSGKVQGTVKVCRTIEEASRMVEPGDILVTHGTDIGWSPFFPILGGIVTELGGLISHGAVVAREYGLPCIVGAPNATKIFISGEQVILDAGKGTLTKVKAQNLAKLDGP